MSDTVKMVVTALLVCAALFGAKKVMDWRDGALRSEQRGATIQTTTGIVRDGAQAADARGKVASGVAEAKHQFDTQIAEDTNNEPEVAERGNRPVPTSRLHAFRERRIARERLGCPGGKCPSGNTSKDSAVR